MHLLVLGATRGIGRHTVDRALEEGHAVRAFARSPGDLPERPGLGIVTGDATSPEDVAPALAGIDAVILAIGLGRAAARFWQPTRLFSSATRALLPRMEESGPKRLIAVTGFGAGESARAMSLIERAGHRAILGRAYADKDRQEEMILASGLDWTIVRPTILTDWPGTGQYRVLSDPATWRNGLIPRADVADYLVRAASGGLNVREAVVLTR
jgi:uncharacterized protein YbjT (DUF2867 family)